LILRFDPHGGDPRRGEEKGEGGAISLSRPWDFGAPRDSFAASVRESRMNRRIAPPQPFAPVDSAETAAALARGSAIAFWIWGAVGLMQAALVWFMGAPEHEAMRGTTAGFAVFFAAIAFLLGRVQWRRPNRLLPGFGMVWAIYELSALSVSLMVGAPL